MAQIKRPTPCCYRAPGAEGSLVGEPPQYSPQPFHLQRKLARAAALAAASALLDLPEAERAALAAWAGDLLGFEPSRRREVVR